MDNTSPIITNNSFWTNLFKNPTEKSELKDMLQSIPAFNQLTNTQIKNLIELTHNRFYEAGEYIFHQGDPGIGLYIVQEGEIRITQNTLDNKQYDVVKFGRGEFFGEMALLDNARRSASAIAVRDSTLTVLFRPDLEDFIDRYPKVGIEILKGMAKIIATRLRNVNEEYLALYTRLTENN